MTYKKIFLLLISLISVSILGFLVYFYYSKIFIQLPSVKVENKVSNKIFDNKSVGPRLTTPFFIEDASSDYSEILRQAKEITLTYHNEGKVDSKITQDFFSSVLSFAFNENNKLKERAYSLNILTSIYLKRQDTKAFYNAVSIYPEYKSEYQKQLKYLKSQKPKNDVKVPSIMKGYVNIYENYATQKTLAMINKKGFDLYPNSYSLLRYGLNTIQSDSLVIKNFQMQDTYKNFADLVKKNYSIDYLPFMEREIGIFQNKGELYKDVNASSYEIDIMTIASLYWIKYELAKTKEEKELILNKILEHAEHMVEVSNLYNSAGYLHIGYSISAVNKVKVAGKKVLPKAQNEKIIQESEMLFRSLLFGTENKQFRNWIRELPREGEIYILLKKLGDKDEVIKNFFLQIDNNYNS